MASETILRLALAGAVALGVAACQDEMQSSFGDSPKALRTLKPETMALMEQKGMRKEDPILVRAFKQESTLEIWKRDNTGKFAFLKSYQMCSWGGTVGPKIREGDKQSPEGFYTVTPGRMNPNSQFHLAYDVGYPNAFDRALGRTGAAVMVHGSCTGSAGCFVMTDEQVEEIYAFAREALSGGQRSFQVQSFPFRMTAENLAKHRHNPNMAFWKNIKTGYDHFEVTKLEPKVDVCDKKYVFDAKPKDAMSSFNSTGACPVYEVPQEIATAVAEKENADERDFKVAVAQIEEQGRKESDRMIAENLEKTKPQAPKTQVASWFGGNGASSETLALASEPVPVEVPLPKPSPRPFGASVQLAMASEPVAAPAPTADRSLTSRLFGFGSSAPEPSVPAAAAIEALPQEATASFEMKPIMTPLPSPRPDLQKTASVAAMPASPASATVPTVAPAVPDETPAPAPVVADKPMWKRLVPFGG